MDYNQDYDFVEDYQDLRILERENNIADTALILLLHGLLYNWGILISYYKSSGSICGEFLRDIIINIITEL